MIRHDAETFELAKMAVEPAAQGRGYGDRLVEAAVEFARAAGARRIILVSNTLLGPALNLYRKHGFRDVPLDPANGYTRADIQLESSDQRWQRITSGWTSSHVANLLGSLPAILLASAIWSANPNPSRYAPGTKQTSLPSRQPRKERSEHFLWDLSE